MQQMELMESKSRVRVALVGDSGAAPQESPVPKAKRARIRLVQREPLAIAEEAAVGYSEWEGRGRPPPCDGYWDTCVKGTDEHQRLWFQKSDDPTTGGGLWYEIRMQKDGFGINPWRCFLGNQSEIGATLIWRGLRAPWPDGYSYVVPGAEAALALGRRKFREPLLADG